MQASDDAGSRWPSDLHTDRSIILLLTLMAVELSRYTRVAIQSYILVQSVWSNATCHNNYDRTIERIFGDRLSVPLVLLWLALVARKVIVISHNFITWWHKAISILCALPTLLSLKGVHTICALQHAVGEARWCFLRVSAGVISHYNSQPCLFIAMILLCPVANTDSRKVERLLAVVFKGWN